MADLVGEWRELSRRVAAVSCALDRTLHDTHGIGMSEFEVLDRLAESDAGLRVCDLAESVHLTQSALSRAVARLERDGLVSRTICPEDRRGIHVQLTAAGQERHTSARPTQRSVLYAHLGGDPGDADRAGADLAGQVGNHSPAG